MDIPSLVKNKKFLGREFLTWLWFQSDINLGVITLEDSESIEIWVGNKIILESDYEDNKERVICHGENSEMFEARQALSQGKKVSQCNFKLCLNDDEWYFTLDDSWLNFRACKTPKVMLNKKEDPGGVFFEKTLLLQKVVQTIDKLFAQFIKIRISQEWRKKYLPDLQNWVQNINE